MLIYKQLNRKTNMSNFETSIKPTHEMTAQEEQDSVVELAKKKNWPNPRESWLMKDEAGPVVVTTVATTGGKAPRELAGSMSPVWGQPYDTKFLGNVSIIGMNLMPNQMKHLTDEAKQNIVEARKESARLHMNQALESIGGPELAADVVVMKPQSDHYKDRTIKGNIVSADDKERSDGYIEDDRPAFMIYSHDPNRVVGIRPADCPTVAFAGHDRDGKPVHGLMHGGWQDEDAGFLEQGLVFLDKDLNVDIKNLNFTVGPGGVNFDYKRPTDPRDGDDPNVVHAGWKTRTTDHEKVNGGVAFVFDMHGFAVDRLKEAGAADSQIFVDSTDTTDPKSGHASHKLAAQGKKPPMRDVVLVLSPDRDK